MSSTITQYIWLLSLLRWNTAEYMIEDLRRTDLRNRFHHAMMLFPRGLILTDISFPSFGVTSTSSSDEARWLPAEAVGPLVVGMAN